jgi:hypothetical protein
VSKKLQCHVLIGPSQVELAAAAHSVSQACTKARHASCCLRQEEPVMLSWPVADLLVSKRLLHRDGTAHKHLSDASTVQPS